MSALIGLARRHAAAMIGDETGLLRLGLISDAQDAWDHPLAARIERAKRDGQISREEAIELSRAHLIMDGRTPQGGKRYVVVTVLEQATSEAVATVRQRAQMLEKATGTIAIAVVMAVSEETEAAAARRGKTQPWLTPHHSENWHDQRGRREDAVPLLKVPE